MRTLGRTAVIAGRLVAVGLLALTLAGCGAETDSSGRDPAPDPDGDSEVLGAEVVQILSATATGGSTETGVVQLDGPVGPTEGIASLTEALTRPELKRDLRRVVQETEVPSGMALVGAIVSIGCDVPSDIAVVGGTEDPVALKPVWTGVKRLPECFAPVTSIGVVLVDQDLVAPRL